MATKRSVAVIIVMDYTDHSPAGIGVKMVTRNLECKCGKIRRTVELANRTWTEESKAMEALINECPLCLKSRTSTIKEAQGERE